ncbi:MULTISPECIES: rhodanese-like domain-containing protein [unclassified Fusibacter]|uniref:rhodanese-like domain-containing protein n=1 Tax=unclassified Fusibacter TaxID=2624464 RepID=UPI001FA9A89E|nr:MULTISPECIES: rhodanese-like domain-containing protein [unclassified Fusibacter]MCK8059387.1 rhodanese-like domain-containing protein [Fusibacter sp. A2]
MKRIGIGIIIVIAAIVGLVLVFQSPKAPATEQTVETESDTKMDGQVDQVDSYRIATPDEALSLMDDGALLIDVRTKEEYVTGHIPLSVLLPVDEIASGIEAIAPDKSATIIVYCRSGNRSKRAAYELIDLGYENVFDLGGIISWPYDIEK